MPIRSNSTALLAREDWLSGTLSRYSRSMSNTGEGPRLLPAAMWSVLVLGCGVAVAILWLYALVAVLAIGGAPTPDATASGRECLNAAAVVSSVAAVIVVVLASILLRRGVHRTGAVVAMLLAVCAPWLPIGAAVFVRLAGE